jgi:UDP-N-acetylmuramate dehydrogenase
VWKPGGGFVEIRDEVMLGPLTTLGVGGPARYFVEVLQEAELVEAMQWAEERGLEVFVLGGGSNLLVADQGFRGLVVRMGIRGVQQNGCSFQVGAGEVWDEFVTLAVQAGCAGVECLAGIPGSVGGTPVQNVGAYGQEVAETVAWVRVLDRRTRAFVELSNLECGFEYRTSVFNTTEKGRYVVTQVGFSLRADGNANLKYADLQKRFAGATPTLMEVAAAVREIRRAKGMLIVEGDADCRSAGSFFKNPVIEAGRVELVAEAAGVSAEEVPHWPAGDGKVKLAAAWLLERAGFVKGFADGAVGISSRHTLAVVTRGGASCADVQRLESTIVEAVLQRFGVRLEREPVLVGAGATGEA